MICTCAMGLFRGGGKEGSYPPPEFTKRGRKKGQKENYMKEMRNGNKQNVKTLPKSKHFCNLVWGGRGVKMCV